MCIMPHQSRSKARGAHLAGLSEWEALLRGDRDGLAMANYPAAAERLAARFAGRDVLELCCGIGATTVFLASVARHVVAVDIEAERLRFAAWNARAQGVRDRVDFIAGDALDSSFLRQFSDRVVFADPAFNPTGRSTDCHTSDLGRTQPPTDDLVHMILDACSPDLALRAAPKVLQSSLFDLGASEVEVVTLGGVPKFQYAFFGALAQATGVIETDICRR